jgi:hypothetical protein
MNSGKAQILLNIGIFAQNLSARSVAVLNALTGFVSLMNQVGLRFFKHREAITPTDTHHLSRSRIVPSSIRLEPNPGIPRIEARVVINLKERTLKMKLQR